MSRRKSQRNSSQGCGAGIESELGPEMRRHPPLVGMTLRCTAQCFPESAGGSQLKCAFFMGFPHFVDSLSPTLAFVYWDDLHAHSWFFMCFWGNTPLADKSSTEFKDE